MTAPTNFLFIMDPYETLNLETETSLLLMQELIERDQGVYWLQPEDLALEHNQPMGRVFQVTDTDPLRRAEPVWTNLDRFDAVLVRKDPPFDTGYLQLTLILDHLDPDIAPAGVISRELVSSTCLSVRPWNPAMPEGLAPARRSRLYQAAEELVPTDSRSCQPPHEAGA